MREWREDRSEGHARDTANLASPSPGKRTQIDPLSSQSMLGGSPIQFGDRSAPVLQAEHSPTGAGGTEAAARKPSRQLTELTRTAIGELDGGKSKKVLLATVLAAARRAELPAFTELLKAAPDADHGDHFILLISELEEDYGSQNTVGILQLFADAGIDITGKLDTFDLQPLAAVAKFKSLVGRFKVLFASGDLSEADQRRLGALIHDASAALRAIEGTPHRASPRVQMAGGVAVAAGAAWKIAGALAADDVTGIGVADDVAIPFVIIGAAALSAIALFSSGPKPVVLDYGPARAKVDAALRQMTELLAISTAMAVQSPRAAGQLGNIAVHLARLLALGSVGGHPSGGPPKKSDRDDKHWWAEIKASLKNYLQATRGASSKQILRELQKYFTEAQLAEIEAALARAEEMMGERIGRILLPP